LGIPKAGGFFLHAAELTLPEIPGEERNLPRTIAAPPPESFVRAAEELFGPAARDILFP
jgi:hypothetical protein